MSWVTTAVVGGGAVAGYLGGTKGKKAQSDPYGQLNPEQRAVNTQLGSDLKDTTFGTQYGGQLTAGMDPTESAFYNPTRAGLMSGTLDSMLQSANDPTAFNNQFNQGMVNPTMQNWQQNIAPGIDEAYSNFSTARGAARQRSLSDVNNSLTMQRYQGQEDAKNRALNAMGQYQNVGNYAAAPRIFQQQGLDRAYNEFTRGNEQRGKNIDAGLKFLGIGTGTYTPAVQDTRLSGAIQGGLSGALMGSLMGGGGGVGGVSSSGSPTSANPYSISGSLGRSGTLADRMGY